MSSQAGIIIIDYGMGNLRSVEKKFERLNTNVSISSDCQVIANAGKLILPGVGHFSQGIRNLRESGIWDVLQDKVLVQQTPILGICLGMQLMALRSEEGNVAGLGWFDAEVVRFRMRDKLIHKVPHIGWNTGERTRQSCLFTGVPEQAMFYFVHSYHITCAQPQDILASTTYEYPFASAIEKGTIFGTQFHPEKSHEWGEQMIANFIAL